MRDVNPLSVRPLAVAATVLFVGLHLVSGVMLARSYARPVIEPAASTAPGDEVTCSTAASKRDLSFPNDWSLGAD